MSLDATPADAKSGCDDGNDDDDKSSEVTGDGAVGDDPPEDKAPGDGAGDDAASSRGSLVSLSAYAGAGRDEAAAHFHAPARPRDEIDANALVSQAHASLIAKALRDLMRLQDRAKLSGNKRELADLLGQILVGDGGEEGGG